MSMLRKFRYYKWCNAFNPQFIIGGWVDPHIIIPKSGLRAIPTEGMLPLYVPGRLKYPRML